MVSDHRNRQSLVDRDNSEHDRLPDITYIESSVNSIMGLETRPWWRHQMETFSALLALCAGNSPVTGEFPSQRPVTQSFDVSFELHLNKRLSKQPWGWWSETPSCPLWRHCNGLMCVVVKVLLEMPWFIARFHWQFKIMFPKTYSKYLIANETFKNLIWLWRAPFCGTRPPTDTVVILHINI